VLGARCSVLSAQCSVLGAGCWVLGRGSEEDAMTGCADGDRKHGWRKAV
jgi:hypothetical protein